ncbi:ABC transporter ATP-binding protein/permease [Paenibacillus sp. N1-5-1-14]|uniref:ABC transporter ATP-binding protein n=1 Tax=Paenibacillus radicibacter TaxID=2972488 RepID=UPI0021598B5D|nr:ABC transporter ATP-binding protein [Paenibacillus radicibacter]MCR8645919.1 ABC transporter ATP-binding protein/permease [Paenibacillus radicibacter]
MGGGGMMPGTMMPGAKAKDFKGSISKLIGYLGKHTRMIILVCILAIISTVFTILGPKILGQATDELFTGVMKQISGTGSINFGKIGEIILLLAGLYGVSALFSYLQGFVMSGVTAKVTFKLRNDISDKMHKLPLGYYDKISHGEVLSRITNDVDTISQTLNQSVTQIITSVASLIGIAIMMFSISWKLTLAALCILPLSMIVIIIVMKKSQRHFKNQQKFLGSVNGHVEEMFGSHVVVKAFGGEEDSSKIFGQYNESLYKSAWKANFLSGLMMPITGFIGNLAYVAICILGGYFAANGTMTIGGIQAFIQYVRSFTQPISQIASISNVLQQTAAAAERVFEFLDEAEEVKEEPNALSVNHNSAAANTLVKVEGHIDFNQVSFGYDPDKIIINNFSAKVKPGQKIAIVGPTGAGKSTIVKLLMRFYDVNSGAITIDGNDIQKFKRDELRSLFGMVLQDTWLFNGTIADNIRYGKLNATDEDVKNAAIAAQVDHFVRTLPEGYNMTLNEEADNISQGQKQLLTIARAILADPKILILDEATSSVDTRTEILIQKAMDNLMEGRTSFVIAHRLSTIRNADLILVMRNGDIVEQGTHEELVGNNGVYTSLYNSQFETAV